MSDTKISALTDGTAVQATDEFPLARSGANFKLSWIEIAQAPGPIGGTTAANGTFLVLTANTSLVIGTAANLSPVSAGLAQLGTGTTIGAGGSLNLTNLTASGTVTSGGTTPFVASVAVSNTSSITSSLNNAVTVWRLINDAGKNIQIVMGGSTTAAAGSIAAGTGYLTSSGVALAVGTNAAVPIQFVTGTGILEQVRILDTASASRYITLTGSNGGNPTISTSAGDLAITGNFVASGNGTLVNLTTTATSSTGTAAIIDGSNVLRPLTSTFRTKQNIREWQPTDEQKRAFLDAPTVIYDYRENGATDVIGFGAEDLAKVSRELVNTDKDGLPYSNREHAILGYMHAIIKQQEARIQTLEKK